MKDCTKSKLEGLNSAGWILGHIALEVEDVFNYLEIEFERNKYWNSLFQAAVGKITILENLPAKAEPIECIKFRYDKLQLVYDNLNSAEKEGPHPSYLLKSKLPDLDAWIAHHLITHISNHCDNLVVWKKIIGIDLYNTRN